MESQKLLEARINETNVFIHPYVLSLDAIKNCFSSLNQLRAVNKITL